MIQQKREERADSNTTEASGHTEVGSGQAAETIQLKRYTTVVTAAGRLRKGDKDSAQVTSHGAKGGKYEGDPLAPGTKIEVDDQQTAQSKGKKVYFWTIVLPERNQAGWFETNKIKTADAYTPQDYAQFLGLEGENAHENAQRILAGEKYTIEEFKKATQAGKVKPLEFGREQQINWGKEVPKVKEVTTELQSGVITPEEHRLEFHNYFGPDVWVIGEVFRNPNLADFYANEAIMAQAEAAEQTKPPKKLAVKNIINTETKKFLEAQSKTGKIKHGDAIDPTVLDAFLIETPIGKLVDRLLMKDLKLNRMSIRGTIYHAQADWNIVLDL